ncbi:MAG: DUF2628 domain-containing protein [Raineya sp.]|nr:DUF2628 domain-containing protein [Raineya sp.]
MLTELEVNLFKRYYKYNSDYYIRQLIYKQHDFNLAAAFLGLFWLAYRKMYLEILIICIITFFEILAIKILFHSDFISIHQAGIIKKVSIAIGIFILGAYANQLYISKSRKVVQKIILEYSNSKLALEVAEEKGGVSWIAPIIVLVATLYILLS